MRAPHRSALEFTNGIVGVQVGDLLGVCTYMSCEADGGRRLTPTGEYVERAVDVPWKSRESPRLRLEWLNFGVAALALSMHTTNTHDSSYAGAQNRLVVVLC